MNKLVRCYDYGSGIDRYTVVYLKPCINKHGRAYYCYRGCSSDPFHPQGVGQTGSTDYLIDLPEYGSKVPRMGRKCHLGKRVSFEALPEQVQKLVRQDLKDPWW